MKIGLTYSTEVVPIHELDSHEYLPDNTVVDDCHDDEAVGFLQIKMHQ